MEFVDSLFEFKSVTDAGLIEGLAAGYGDVDSGGDRIIAGAMAKSLAARGTRPLPMLLHHDQRRPVGAWTEWRESSKGLHVKGRLSLGTRDADEAHQLARDGALTGLSIGYQPGASPTYDAEGARVLSDIKLFEASLVAIPMHDRARIASVKDFTGAKDIADVLRDAGMSGRLAKAAAGAGWRAINDLPDEAAADAELAALFSQSTNRIANL